MSVEWCPKGEITGELLTKSNQGYILGIFRDLIMGDMTQTDISNGKRVDINKREAKKIKK